MRNRKRRKKDLDDRLDELADRVKDNHDDASMAEEVLGVTVLKDVVDVADVGLDIVSDLFDW